MKRCGHRLLMSACLSIFIMIIGCKQDEFEKLRNGDFSNVLEGTYRGTAVFLKEHGEYAAMIHDARTYIEKNRDVLPTISQHFFPTDDTLLYTFKFAAYDSTQGYFIVRYFARIRDDPVYAGYQIQFVFDSTGTTVVRIYTSEVPLE